MQLDLNGKVALVTGASRGIGAAIAEELAREGADLLLSASGSTDLAAVAATLCESTGRRVAIHAGDLRSRITADDLVRAAVGEFGALDILVNCAGNTRSAHVLQVSDDDWNEAFEVKVHANLRMCRSAWPHLRAARGCVINIAGNTSRTARADYALNGAVNSALVSLTKALSDVGRREGVRVNAINPGRIATRRLATAIDGIASRERVDREHASRRLLEVSGISRFGEPREIGWLAAYLASPRAEFIQGAIVDIDGGETRVL